MVNGELPDGWQMTTLGEATKPMQKRVNPQDYPDLPYIGMENVEAHTMRLLGTVPSKEMKSTADSFSAGDVLYGRLRPYLNKVYLPDFDGLCSTEFIVFRKVPHLYSKYLQYFLNSWEFVQFSNSLNAGDRPRVKFEQFADYSFPLPSLPEQERIVAKIEALFTQLDAGTSALEKVQAGLRRYKASVLKAAVEGKLLENRELEESGELPDGWRWATVDELKKTEPNAICAGPFGTIFKAKDFRPNGVPIIFLRHVAPGKYLTHRPTFMDEEKWKELFIPYSVFGGELLITKLGDPPGVCAIYPEGIGHAMVTPDVIKMSVDEAKVLPTYLMHYFNSEISRKISSDLAFGTTRLRLTIPIFRELQVPLPSLEEQRRIVAEVERRLSVAREVESVVEKALVRAGRLRQSVLKSAFEGRLV